MTNVDPSQKKVFLTKIKVFFDQSSLPEGRRGEERRGEREERRGRGEGRKGGEGG